MRTTESASQSRKRVAPDQINAMIARFLIVARAVGAPA
jgi:hypothetical protein